MAYLLPKTANTVIHVSALDLSNGTTDAGSVWTKIGTPPLNAAGVSSPANIGPFSSSNYYSQASSPLNFASGPFTVAMIIKTGPDVTTQQLFLTSPPGDASKWYAQISVSKFLFGGTLSAGAGSAGLVYTPYLVMFGVDGGGTGYIQVNNGTLVTGTAPALGGTGAALLGNFVGGGGFGGDFIELMASTDAPSATLFNSLYATVAAGGPPTPAVLVSASAVSASLSSITASPQAAATFGTDINAFGDLDPRFGLLSGQQNLTQAILHRLSTKRGLLAYAPNDGYDTRQLLNESASSANGVGLTQMQQAIETEVEKDERVQSASAVVTLVPATSSLTISLSVNTVTGQTLSLVLSVNGVTLTLLQGN